MRRKIILVLASLIIISTAAYLYIDSVFLPVQFRQYITLKTKEALQRDVSIGRVGFRLFQGFVVENITIAQKDDPNRPFLQVREAKFNLLLMPLLRQHTVIFPHIKIRDPHIALSRDENGTWNFSDLIALVKAEKSERSFAVLLQALTLEGGEISYEDKTQSGIFTETVKDIRVGATLSLHKGIQFALHARIPDKKTILKISGNYVLKSREFTAQTFVENLPLARYLPLLTTSQSYITLPDGILSSADLLITAKGPELQARGKFVIDRADMRIGEARRLQGSCSVPDMTLTWRDRKWDAKGHIACPSVQATGAGNQTFQGNLSAELTFLTAHENSMTCQGNFSIENADLTFGENRHFSGTIQAADTSLIKGDGKIRVQGDFDIQKAAFTFDQQAALKGDLTAKGTDLVWSLDEDGEPSLDARSGLTVNGADFSFGNSRTMTGAITAPALSVQYADGKTVLKASGQMEAANIHFSPGQRFQGRPSFDLSYTYDPQKENPTNYKGSITFVNGLWTGLPHIAQASQMSGAITVTPGRLQSDRLTFTAQEADILLSGSLNDFANPSVMINASSANIRIEKLLAFFPAFREKLHAELSGPAAAQMSYHGPLSAPADAVIHATVKLHEATLRHENLPDPVTGISGELYCRKDFLRWRNLRGFYQGNSYAFTGELDDFSRPLIVTSLVGEKVDLKAQIRLLRSAFQLIALTGRYRDSSFDLKGDVHLFGNDDADIDLRGKLDLSLGDLGIIFPRLKDRVQQFQPLGVLSGQGIFMGKASNWRDWQLAFEGSSEKILLKGYPLENVSVRYTQRDRTISKCNLASLIYGGNLDITTSVDLRTDEVPFTATVSLKDLDLAKYREDQKPKNRQLAGILQASAALQGNALQWRKMTGTGTVKIADGNLWHLSILSGIAKALLIPEFEHSVFTEGRGDFTVENGKFNTENARMTSQYVTLNGKGWIDFDTNISFDIQPEFSELAILQSGSLKKGPTSIITQTDDYLHIKLTGTLKHPRHEVIKSPMKILEGTIKDTTGTIKEVIGGVVDEIF
jgi:uncharacterized protein involved in outer membrane biogenesis